MNEICEGVIAIENTVISGLPEGVLAAGGYATGDKWRHFVMSWSKDGSGRVRIYNDVGLETEVVMDTDLEVLEDVGLAELAGADVSVPTKLSLGVGYMTDSDLVGELDSICVYAYGLSYEESLSARLYGCEGGGDTASLAPVSSFSFDDENRPLLDGVTGVENMLPNTLSDRGDGKGPGPYSQVSTLQSTPGGSPIFVRPSSPPSGGGGTTTPVVTASPLFCSGCDAATDRIKYTVLPPAPGKLCREAAGLTASAGGCGVAGYQEIGAGDELTNAQAEAVKYMSSETTDAGDEVYFEAELVGEEDDVNWRATIRTNTPPVVQDFTFEVDELVDFKALWLPSRWELMDDPDGAFNSFTAELRSFHGTAVTLYDCAECMLALTDVEAGGGGGSIEDMDWTGMVALFPHTVNNGLYREIAVIPSIALDDGTTATLTFRVHDGFDYSNVATVHIVVLRKNFAPIASLSSADDLVDYTTSEDGRLEVDLSSRISDREGDVCLLTIDKFPEHGVLYQVDGVSAGSPLLESDKTSNILSQWVVEDDPDNDYSSCYSDEYCIFAAAGEPNQWPSTEDTPSWQPDGTDMSDLWVVINYETPVFFKELTLYECWSPGALVKIEALDYDDQHPPDEEPNWVVVYEGTNRQSSFCPEKKTFERCAGVSNYLLCPKPFRSRTFRLTWELDDLDMRWESLDAVLLVGTSNPASTAIQGIDNTKIEYVPNKHYFGADEFHFSAMDCAYFDFYGFLRGPDSRRGVVPIVVKPEPDDSEFVDDDENDNVEVSTDTSTSDARRFWAIAYPDTKTGVSPVKTFYVNVRDYDGVVVDGKLDLTVTAVVSTSLFGELSVVGTDQSRTVIPVGAGHKKTLSIVHVRSAWALGDVPGRSSYGTIAFEFTPFVCTEDHRKSGTLEIRIEGDQGAGNDRVYDLTVKCDTFIIDNSKTIIIGAVSGILGTLFLFALVAFFHDRKTKAVVQHLQEDMAVGKKRNAELSSKVTLMKSLNEKLEDVIRRSNHTDAEIDIMREQGKKVTDESSTYPLKGILVKAEDVELIGMLGKGAFGAVHSGMFRGEKVAIKQLIAITPENVQRFHFECFLMNNLRSPNIVNLIGVVWDDTMIACILELAPRGSLGDLIKKDFALPPKEKITWEGRLLRFAIGAATGIHFLHRTRYFDDNENKWMESIIHRDLKPENFLVMEDWTLKLADFGEARHASDLQMTVVGTPIYMAPEILQGDHYDVKADVYSFGIVLVAMLRHQENVVDYFFERLRIEMKKPNMSGIGIQMLNNKMFMKNWRPSLGPIYPSLAGLIDSMWQTKPSRRPSFEEILDLLMGDISREVNTMEEPDLLTYSDADAAPPLKALGATESAQNKQLSPADALRSQIATRELGSIGAAATGVTSRDIIDELIRMNVVSEPILRRITDDLKVAFDQKKLNKDIEKDMEHQKMIEHMKIVKSNSIAAEKDKAAKRESKKMDRTAKQAASELERSGVTQKA